MSGQRIWQSVVTFAAIVLMSTSPLEAAIVNGNFSQGLAGWTYGIEPLPDPNTLNTGLASNTILGGRALVSYSYGGFNSASPFFNPLPSFTPFFSQQFTADAGSAVKFNAHWNLAANGGEASVSVLITGDNKFSTGLSVSDFSHGFVNSQGDFRYTLPAAGTYTIKITAYSFGDFVQQSPSPFFEITSANASIDVDNITLVPEPATALLASMGGGVVGVIVAARRRLRR